MGSQHGFASLGRSIFAETGHRGLPLTRRYGAGVNGACRCPDGTENEKRVLWQLDCFVPSHQEPTAWAMRFWTIYRRALRLRCPACGEGRLFTGWFSMPPDCDQCGLKYDKAPGYFLGAIYFNYGLTALVVTAAYFIGYFAFDIAPNTLLWSLTLFCFLFPLWFFR